MITKITDAIAQRRDALKDGENDKGFTLIELMVVVIIIGILAAIAIPAFLGQQNSAKDAAAKSDISNAKLALIGYASSTGSYQTSASASPTVTDLKNYGFVQSGNNAPLIVTDAAGVYCISEKSDTGTFYKVLSTSNSAVSAAAACTTTTG